MARASPRTDQKVPNAMDVALKILPLGEMFVGVYAILLVTYFISAFTVLFLGRRSPELKIQERIAGRKEERRDIRQSFFSLAYIAGFVSFGWFGNTVLGLGFHLRHPTILNTALTFVGSMILYDTWFYWFHRLVHWKPLYRVVHRGHHLSVTPTVWSNNSDHFLDNAFIQSYWMFAHFLIPVAPLVLLVHKIYDQVTGVVGHSGYEIGGLMCQPPSPMISTTNHDQHHRSFRYNFATHFTIWDRLMGTMHPDHDAELRRIARRTKIASRARADQARARKAGASQTAA
jgi:sterol desaturase/sphingolipid hydroxylase (fatty acid hydroxylase superfamily)